MKFKIGDLIKYVGADGSSEGHIYLIIGWQLGLPKWISLGKWDDSFIERPNVPFYKLLTSECLIDFVHDQGNKTFKFYKKIS